MKRLILSIVMALLVTTPLYAKEIRDPLGRTHLVDDATAITPGAGSGMGAFIGIDVDSNLTYVRRDVDVFFTLAGTGATDGSTGEQVLMALGGRYYLNETIAIGLQIGRPDVDDPHLWTARPEIKMYLGYDYTDNTLKGIKMSFFGYSIDTDGGKGSGSFDPAVLGCMEIPVKYGTIGLEGGVGYAFTQYDQDVEQLFAVGGLTFNLFAVRAGGTQ